MDLNALVEDLRNAADNLRKNPNNGKPLSTVYCHKVLKVVEKVSNSSCDYENIITGLWVIIAHFTETLDILLQVPSFKEAATRLFRECAKAVLNIQWQNLEEESDVRQRFVISLGNLNSKLGPLSYQRFRLLESLLENPWTDPTLAKIMGGEAEDDEEKEEVRSYIAAEDAIILQLRVDMMLKENCEEYALNLCNSCLLHPELKRDLTLRKTQLSLLHKLGLRDKLQEECQNLSVQEAVNVIRQLQTRNTKEICTVLAQTFMVQHWIRQKDHKANKDLLRLWIRQQALADKDQDRFKESVWAIAKLSQSTEQILFFIDILREQCGKTYIQLYIDMCIFAINVDKGQMETNLKQEEMDMVKARKEDMSAICGKLACLNHHASIKVARICVLTAFALKPSLETFQSIIKVYSQNYNCCGTCNKTANAVDHGTVNPATLYEVERLLNMLRPEYLNPDNSLSNIKILCERFCKENNLNIQLTTNVPKPPEEKSQLRVVQIEAFGKPKASSTKPSNVFEAVAPSNVNNTQGLLRIQSQPQRSHSSNVQSIQISAAQHSRPNILHSGPRHPSPSASLQLKGNANILEPYRSRQPSLQPNQLRQSTSQSNSNTPSSHAQGKQILTPAKSPIKLNPQLIQYIQSAIRQNSSVVQELIKHPDKEIVRTVINMLNQAGKSNVGANSIRPVPPPPQQQASSTLLRDRSRLPNTTPLLRPSSSSSATGTSSFQTSQSYSHHMSNQSIQSSTGTNPNAAYMQKAESFRKAKIQAGNIRSVVQTSLLQKQEVLSRQQMSGSTLTVNQSPSRLPQNSQNTNRNSTKHIQPHGIIQLQPSGNIPGHSTLNSQNISLSTSRNTTQQQLQSQSNSQQPVLPSDELSGSIMGIDDKIISELLKDAGIFSNTFPDIEVDVSGLEDLDKKNDARMTVASLNSQNSYTSRVAISSLPQQHGIASSLAFSSSNITPNRLSTFDTINSNNLVSSTKHYRPSPVSTIAPKPSQQSNVQINSLQQPMKALPQLSVEQIREMMKKEQIDGEVTMDSSNNATYRCIICSLAFKELEELREHVRNVCKPGLQSSSVYNTKIKQDHANSAKAGLETTTVFQCLRCFELCISQDGIKQHRLTCKRVPTVPPDIKNATLNSKSNKTPPSSRSSTPKMSSAQSHNKPTATVITKVTNTQLSKMPEKPLSSTFPSSSSITRDPNQSVPVSSGGGFMVNASVIGTNSTVSTTQTNQPSVQVKDEKLEIDPTPNLSATLTKREVTVKQKEEEEDEKIKTEISENKTEPPKSENNIPQPRNEKAVPPLTPSNYSEISGSGGCKFYRCKNCTQTLCSFESLLSHWKDCATKPPIIPFRTQQFPLDPDDELEPGEIRPLVGKVLKNVLDVIDAVARGDIGEMPVIDSDVEDLDILLAQGGPNGGAHDSHKIPQGQISKKEYWPQSFLNSDDSSSNSSGQVSSRKISCLPMKKDPIGKGVLKEKNEEVNTPRIASTVATSRINKSLRKLSYEESGHTDEDESTSDGSNESSPEAPPTLRDRTKLRPVQTFLNESFVSPYSRCGTQKSSPVSNLRSKDSKSKEKSTNLELSDSEKGDFKCIVCSKICNSKRILIQHYAGKHLQPYTMKTLTDGSSYFCHLCQKSFSTFMHYMHHIPSHGGIIMKKMTSQYSSLNQKKKHWSSRIAASRGFTVSNGTKIGGISPKRAKALLSKKKAAKSARERMKKVLSQLSSSSQYGKAKANIVNKKIERTDRKRNNTRQGLQEKLLKRKIERKRRAFSKDVPLSETEDSCASSSPYMSDVSDGDEYCASDDDSDSTVNEPPQTRNRSRLTRSNTKFRSKNNDQGSAKIDPNSLTVYPESLKTSNIFPCVSVQRLTESEIQKFSRSNVTTATEGVLSATEMKENTPKHTADDDLRSNGPTGKDAAQNLMESTNSVESSQKPLEDILKLGEEKKPLCPKVNFQSSFESYIKECSMSKKKTQHVDQKSSSTDISGKQHNNQHSVPKIKGVLSVPIEEDVRDSTNFGDLLLKEKEIISSAKKRRCSVNLGLKVDLDQTNPNPKLPEAKDHDVIRASSCKSPVIGASRKSDDQLTEGLPKDVKSLLSACTVVIERTEVESKMAKYPDKNVSIASDSFCNKISTESDAAISNESRVVSDETETEVKDSNLSAFESKVVECSKKNITAIKSTPHDSECSDTEISPFENKFEQFLMIEKDKNEVKDIPSSSKTSYLTVDDKFEIFVSPQKVSSSSESKCHDQLSKVKVKTSPQEDIDTKIENFQMSKNTEMDSENVIVIDEEDDNVGKDSEDVIVIGEEDVNDIKADSLKEEDAYFVPNTTKPKEDVVCTKDVGKDGGEFSIDPGSELAHMKKENPRVQTENSNSNSENGKVDNSISIGKEAANRMLDANDFLDDADDDACLKNELQRVVARITEENSVDVSSDGNSFSKKDEESTKEGNILKQFELSDEKELFVSNARVNENNSEEVSENGDVIMGDVLSSEGNESCTRPYVNKIDGAEEDDNETFERVIQSKKVRPENEPIDNDDESKEEGVVEKLCDDGLNIERPVESSDQPGESTDISSFDKGCVIEMDSSVENACQIKESCQLSSMSALYPEATLLDRDKGGSLILDNNSKSNVDQPILTESDKTIEREDLISNAKDLSDTENKHVGDDALGASNQNLDLNGGNGMGENLMNGNVMNEETQLDQPATSFVENARIMEKDEEQDATSLRLSPEKCSNANVAESKPLDEMVEETEYDGRFSLGTEKSSEEGDMRAGPSDETKEEEDSNNVCIEHNNAMENQNEDRADVQSNKEEEKFTEVHEERQVEEEVGLDQDYEDGKRGNFLGECRKVLNIGAINEDEIRDDDAKGGANEDKAETPGDLIVMTHTDNAAASPENEDGNVSGMVTPNDNENPTIERKETQSDDNTEDKEEHYESDIELLDIGQQNDDSVNTHSFSQNNDEGDMKDCDGEPCIQNVGGALESKNGGTDPEDIASDVPLSGDRHNEMTYAVEEQKKDCSNDDKEMDNGEIKQMCKDEDYEASVYISNTDIVGVPDKSETCEGPDQCNTNTEDGAEKNEPSIESEELVATSAGSIEEDGGDVCEGDGGDVCEGDGGDVCEEDGGDVCEGDGGDVCEDDGGDVCEDDGGDVCEGDGGDVCEGDGGDVCEEDGGDVCEGDGGDVCEDDGGDVCEEDGGDVCEEDGDDVCEDDGGDVCKNDGGDICEEDGGDVCEGDDGDVCEDDGGDVCEDDGGDGCEGNGGDVCEDDGGDVYEGDGGNVCEDDWSVNIKETVQGIVSNNLVCADNLSDQETLALRTIEKELASQEMHAPDRDQETERSCKQVRESEQFMERADVENVDDVIEYEEAANSDQPVKHLERCVEKDFDVSQSECFKSAEENKNDVSDSTTFITSEDMEGNQDGEASIDRGSGQGRVETSFTQAEENDVEMENVNGQQTLVADVCENIQQKYNEKEDEAIEKTVLAKEVDGKVCGEDQEDEGLDSKDVVNFAENSSKECKTEVEYAKVTIDSSGRTQSKIHSSLPQESDEPHVDDYQQSDGVEDPPVRESTEDYLPSDIVTKEKVNQGEDQEETSGAIVEKQNQTTSSTNKNLPFDPKSKQNVPASNKDSHFSSRICSPDIDLEQSNINIKEMDEDVAGDLCGAELDNSANEATNVEITTSQDDEPTFQGKAELIDNNNKNNQRVIVGLVAAVDEDHDQVQTTMATDGANDAVNNNEGQEDNKDVNTSNTVLGVEKTDVLLNEDSVTDKEVCDLHIPGASDLLSEKAGVTVSKDAVQKSRDTKSCTPRNSPKQLRTRKKVYYGHNSVIKLSDDVVNEHDVEMKTGEKDRKTTKKGIVKKNKNVIQETLKSTRRRSDRSKKCISSGPEEKCVSEEKVTKSEATGKTFHVESNVDKAKDLERSDDIVTVKTDVPQLAQIDNVCSEAVEKKYVESACNSFEESSKDGSLIEICDKQFEFKANLKKDVSSSSENNITDSEDDVSERELIARKDMQDMVMKKRMSSCLNKSLRRKKLTVCGEIEHHTDTEECEESSSTQVTNCASKKTENASNNEIVDDGVVKKTFSDSKCNEGHLNPPDAIRGISTHANGSDEEDLTDYNLVVEEDTSFKSFPNPFVHSSNKLRSSNGIDDSEKLEKSKKASIKKNKLLKPDSDSTKESLPMSFSINCRNKQVGDNSKIEKEKSVTKKMTWLEKKRLAFNEKKKEEAAPFTWDLEENAKTPGKEKGVQSKSSNTTRRSKGRQKKVVSTSPKVVKGDRGKKINKTEVVSHTVYNVDKGIDDSQMETCKDIIALQKDSVQCVESDTVEKRSSKSSIPGEIVKGLKTKEICKSCLSVEESSSEGLQKEFDDKQNEFKANIVIEEESSISESSKTDSEDVVSDRELIARKDVQDIIMRRRRSSSLNKSLRRTSSTDCGEKQHIDDENCEEASITINPDLEAEKADEKDNASEQDNNDENIADEKLSVSKCGEEAKSMKGASSQAHGSDEEDLSNYNLVVEEDTSSFKNFPNPFVHHSNKRSRKSSSSSSVDSNEKVDKSKGKSLKCDGENRQDSLPTQSSICDGSEQVCNNSKTEKGKLVTTKMTWLERKRLAFKEKKKEEAAPFTWDLEENSSTERRKGDKPNMSNNAHLSVGFETQLERLEHGVGATLASGQFSQQKEEEKSSEASKSKTENNDRISKPTSSQNNSTKRFSRKRLSSSTPQGIAKVKKKPKSASISTAGSECSSKESSVSSASKKRGRSKKSSSDASLDKDTNVSEEKSNENPHFININDDEITFNTRSLSPLYTSENTPKDQTKSKGKKRGRPKKRPLEESETTPHQSVKAKQNNISDSHSPSMNVHDPKPNKAGLIPVAKASTPVPCTQSPLARKDIASPSLDSPSDASRIGPSSHSVVKKAKPSPVVSKQDLQSKKTPEHPVIVAKKVTKSPAWPSKTKSPIPGSSSSSLCVETPTIKKDQMKKDNTSVHESPDALSTAAVVKRRNPTSVRKHDFQYSMKRKQTPPAKTTTIYKVDPLPKVTSSSSSQTLSSEQFEKDRTLHTPLPPGVTHVTTKPQKAIGSDGKWKIAKEMKPTKAKAKQRRAPVSFKRT